MQVKANADGAVRKLRLAVANCEKARRQGVNLIARAMVHGLARHSPTDTNRYVRGWIQAGQVAGIAGLPMMPALKESRYHKAAVPRMEHWVETLGSRLRALSQQRDDKYPNGKPRKGGRGYENLSDRIKTANDRYLRAREDLETLKGDPYALVFGAGTPVSNGRFVRADSPNLKTRKGRPKRISVWVRGDKVAKFISNGRTAVSIRTKVYGGWGIVRHLNGRSLLTLHNREAHALIVEARAGVVRKVKSMLGLRTLTGQQRQYLTMALKAASSGTTVRV